MVHTESFDPRRASFLKMWFQRMVNLKKLLPILSVATLLSAVLMTAGCSNTQAKQPARTGKKVEETKELVNAS